MKAHTTKIIGEGLTYDDVLLIPNYSEVLPREVNIQSRFSRNIVDVGSTKRINTLGIIPNHTNVLKPIGKSTNNQIL